MRGPFLLLLPLLCASALGKEPEWPKTEAHALDLLERYIRIASVNPPANTTDAARFLAAELSANGVEAKAYASAPGKVNLLARLPGRNRSLRPLLLLNHIDVVPVDKSRWAENPFGGALKDGQVWGRGSLDMKSTGIIQLITLLLLKQLGIVPPRDIVFLSTCDEESGGVSGAAWMIQTHWDELNPEYVLDEGGVGSRDIYSPGKLIFGVSVADKQLLWLKMRAVGTSGQDRSQSRITRTIDCLKLLPRPKHFHRQRSRTRLFRTCGKKQALSRRTSSSTQLDRIQSH